MSPALLRRSHGPRRTRLPRRALSVGAGGLLVGAMVLTAATSSAHDATGLPIRAETTALPAAGADIVASSAQPLRGFAPPPKRTDPLPLPQFRVMGNLPSGPLGIPGVVLQAYKLAANRVSAETPCKLPWFLLAGIGRIESNHASNGSVDQFGNTINPILGPTLDGSLPGNEVIRHGAGHARAMGPMQFIPGTWAAWGSDANGDGKADPQNVFDATYSAGRYLCSGVTDIMAGDHKVSSVFRYNHSMEYVSNVLGWAAAYATGVMPTTPIPELKHKPAASSSTKPKPTPKPGDPSASTSTPSTPSTPPPPAPTCLGGICLPPNLLPPNLLPGAPQPAPQKPAPGAKRSAPASPRAPGAVAPAQPAPMVPPR